MDRRSLSEKSATLSVNSGPHKPLTLEDTTKDKGVSDSTQVSIESLSTEISGVEDPTIYLVADRVKRVGGKWWVRVLDVMDVRRAK